MIFSSDADKKATMLTKRNITKSCPSYLSSSENAADPGNLYAGQSLEVRKGAARPGKATRAVPLQTTEPSAKIFRAA